MPCPAIPKGRFRRWCCCRSGIPPRSWDREIILEVATVEVTAWDAELDTLWEAIRHRLTSWSAVITAWGPAEFIPPFVAGEICGMRIPLTLTYQLNFSE